MGGVAHTRHPLSIHFHCQNTPKNDCSKWEKRVKNYSEDYIQITCTSSKHDKDICKVSKNQNKTVGGVAHTRYILL